MPSKLAKLTLHNDTVQVTYIQLNSNQLSGSLPGEWRELTQLKYIDLSRNSVSGILDSGALPSNLSYLDLSYNKLAGELPNTLLPTLSVLNLTHNGFVGSLPAQWSTSMSIAVIQLDNNSITGKLPSSWADFGKSTGNSVQLSAVNTSLHGAIPQDWVQQFCLDVVNNGSRLEERTLYQPQQVELSFSRQGLLSMSTRVGYPVVLPPQYASIQVSLGGKVQSLTYADPSGVCGIPHALRNIVLLWVLFAMLLLAVALSFYFWFRCMPVSPSHPVKRLIVRFENVVLQHRAWYVVQLTWEAVQFVVLDVVYYVYSIVSDILVIHQLLKADNKYGYVLLGVLLLHYILVMAVVTWTHVKAEADKCRRQSVSCRAKRVAIGIAWSPVILVVLQFGVVLHCLRIPMPKYIEHKFPGLPDVSAFYRLSSLIESIFNALPQSVLQTRFYLLGNTPKGLGQYINTKLFLYSVFGSLLSILKSFAVGLHGYHRAGQGFTLYVAQVVQCSPLQPKDSAAPLAHQEIQITEQLTHR